MKNWFLTLAIVISSISAFAQGTIRGFVYDEETGEPIIFTTVFLKGTTYGASTDVNGYFSITKVKPGSYKLMVTYIGYDTASVYITIKGNEIINQKLFIKKSSIKLKTVDISAEKQELKTQVKMSVTKVTPKEISSMPSVGGEPDLAQYLQVLPGVVFTGSQGGQLYIRGGTPIQNKVLLDGLIIYNPFHSIGLFSVFDTDIMRNADIYTGGFGAKYGGRISSIMDITTRDGNKNRLSGKVSASTFGAKVLVEGPLSKPKKIGGSSSSFIVSAKHSYIENSAELLYKPFYQNLSESNPNFQTGGIDTTGLPYKFTDIYSKLSFNSENGSKINFFGFRYDDNVNYSGVSRLNWKSFGLGTNFVLIPGKSSTLIEGVIAYSSYGVLLDEFDGSPDSSSINGFNAGMTFTNFNGDNESKYGFEIQGFKTDYQFYNSVNRKIQQFQNTTQFAGFLSWRFNMKKLVLEPGFRIIYYASLTQFSPEPRLAAKYNISDKLRVKLATGMYSQNLVSSTSDRNVVNLFYGFLSAPDNLQSEFTDKNGNVKEVKHNLQKANHAILGFEYDVNNFINVNIEGYYKRFTQLINTNRNKLFDDNAANADVDDMLKKDFIIETGDAYGFDVVVKYQSTHFNIYAVYSLNKVLRWDGIQEYYTSFDRRHNVNFVGSYIFGEDLDWEFDVRWNLGSGFPFTPTQGLYDNIPFNNVNTDYTSVNGDPKLIYGEINSKRLPYYHRLDFTLKRKFTISENSILQATASVTNVYNRANIFYVNRITGKVVHQLPLMPSIGLSLTF
tara:strand:- start:55932 stop:58286 length:2355 start_codon:yes stop_codon:yes gene_type:complete